MTKFDKKKQPPGVVFQQKAREGLQGGINAIVGAIRPTLGPLPRLVVNDRGAKTGGPEFLDDGAIIARRIIQLSNREEDMGAMYLRHLLWKMRETIGDGTATAAVMFHTIYNHGIRYIVAGGNAMRLRLYLEEGVKVILYGLETMVIRLQGKEQFARLAETICYDPPLAKMLGEIFDIIGEYGHLDIRTGRSRELEREYIEGMYWGGGVFSREVIEDPMLGRVQLENVAILISDLEIKEPQELLPILDMAVHADIKSLILVASAISDRALSVLLIKPNREKIQVIPVKAPARDTLTRSEALQDLAMLTGGQAFYQAAGGALSSVQVNDLGHARRAWADASNSGIVGGKGDPRRLRRYIAQLRAALMNINEPAGHSHMQERIGKLISGSAVLWVGGYSPLAIEARKALAERTSEAMRGAIREGVLPGGGVALLACQEALQKRMRSAEDADERTAYSILLKAIQTPIRTLVANAGFEPDKVLHQILLAGPGFGFDVIHGQVVNMAQSGLFDASSVVKAATFNAVHGAALALTIDILIHRKYPPYNYSTP
jgi:chaperonin GroEL